MRPTLFVVLLTAGCPYINNPTDDRDDWPCEELADWPDTWLTTDDITQTLPVFEWDAVALQMGNPGANTYEVNAVTFTPEHTGEYTIALGEDLGLRTWIYQGADGYRDADAVRHPACPEVAVAYDVPMNAGEQVGIGLLFRGVPVTPFFIAPANGT